MKSTGSASAGNREQAWAVDLLSAQEEQNKHLARELHDVVSQKLATLGIEIDTLERKPPKSREQLRARLRRLSTRVASLSNAMHEIARQLHPSILEDLGLADALRSECAVFSELYGNLVTFKAENLPENVPENVALCLYRIAQESLRNAGRHAPGAPVWVHLTGGLRAIELSVKDAGPGFRRERGRVRGLGLISMEERARLVKGKFRVLSEAGRGTVVEVRVPLPARGRSVAASVSSGG